MEESNKNMSPAQLVLLSSALTLLIVVGVLFSVKELIVQYLVAEVQHATQLSLPAAEENEEPIVTMVKRVEPAVVSVVVTKDVPIYEQYYERFGPWGLFTVPRVRENGTEEREVGGGSGFIVSGEGHIVTNNHVVADEMARYSVVLHDGTPYTVDVLARDPELDVAVLQIKESIPGPLTTIEFGDSTTLALGQTVIAIGNALAEFQNSVSVGVISGLSRSIVASDMSGHSEQLDQVIQTDAAINPGNSGGPLLNLEGEVIGVNVAISQGADNIGFALPAATVKQVVDSVRQYGEIVRPYLGVRYTMLSTRLAETNGLSVSYGALIAKGPHGDPAIMPGSPAEKAGLAENDIILAVDGEELRDKTLASVLRTKAVGQTISLRVLSGDTEKMLTITLERLP